MDVIKPSHSPLLWVVLTQLPFKSLSHSDLSCTLHSPCSPSRGRLGVLVPCAPAHVLDEGDGLGGRSMGGRIRKVHVQISSLVLNGCVILDKTLKVSESQ